MNEWTDGRIADAFREVREDIKNLSRDFREYRDEQAADAEARRRERKADLKWIVATIIAASAVIVAAVGLIVGTAG